MPKNFVPTRAGEDRLQFPPALPLHSTPAAHHSGVLSLPILFPTASMSAPFATRCIIKTFFQLDVCRADALSPRSPASPPLVSQTGPSWARRRAAR